MLAEDRPSTVDYLGKGRRLQPSDKDRLGQDYGLQKLRDKRRLELGSFPAHLRPHRGPGLSVAAVYSADKAAVHLVRRRAAVTAHMDRMGALVSEGDANVAVLRQLIELQGDPQRVEHDGPATTTYVAAAAAAAVLVLPPRPAPPHLPSPLSRYDFERELTHLPEKPEYYHGSAEHKKLREAKAKQREAQRLADLETRAAPRALRAVTAGDATRSLAETAASDYERGSSSVRSQSASAGETRRRRAAREAARALYATASPSATLYTPGASLTISLADRTDLTFAVDEASLYAPQGPEAPSVVRPLMSDADTLSVSRRHHSRPKTAPTVGRARRSSTLAGRQRAAHTRAIDLETTRLRSVKASVDARHAAQAERR